MSSASIKDADVEKILEEYPSLLAMRKFLQIRKRVVIIRETILTQIRSGECGEGPNMRFTYTITPLADQRGMVIRRAHVLLIIHPGGIEAMAEVFEEDITPIEFEALNAACKMYLAEENLEPSE